MKKLVVLFIVLILLCGCGKSNKERIYNYDEIATNGEVNIKISDITFYEDYVELILAFENISKNGIEYDPLDFTLQTSDGNNEKYIYSSREATSLSSGGQITWKLRFNYYSAEDMKLVYKKDFNNKTITILIDYDKLTGIPFNSCNTNGDPFEIAVCETVNGKGIVIVLEDNLTNDETNTLLNNIKSISGVQTIIEVSKEDLYNTLVDNHPRYENSSIDTLNFEDVIIIKTATATDIGNLAKNIQIIKNVKSVMYWG